MPPEPGIAAIKSPTPHVRWGIYMSYPWDERLVR